MFQSILKQHFFIFFPNWKMTPPPPNWKIPIRFFCFVFEAFSKSELEASKDATNKAVPREKSSGRRKRCRYYNRGYCKYVSKCRYFHPEGICEDYEKHQKCERKECWERHPRRCKWEQSDGGCKRNLECVYLHASQTNKEVENMTNLNFTGANGYKCVSCKCVWQNKNCLVVHTVKSTSVLFCLNCSD